MKLPAHEDYIKVYIWHGMEKGDFLRKTPDKEGVEAAFRQISDLSRHHSSFNELLPKEFLDVLRSWHQNDPVALDQFKTLESKVLFLSDFLDYLRIMEKNIPG